MTVPEKLECVKIQTVAGQTSEVVNQSPLVASIVEKYNNPNVVK